jgi:hypothetical protein
MTDARPSNKQRGKQAPAGETPGGQSTAGAAPDERRDSVAKVGALFGRSIDLVEAGLNLGVTFFTQVGAVAQKQLFDRLANITAGSAAPMAAGPPSAMPPDAAAAAPEPEAYGIRNPLPLLPGARVHVPFSINNNSMETPNKLSLRVEGFTGDAQGHGFDAALFAVKPAHRTIAPMDFEKFVLEGVLPQNVQPDVYHGCVIVSSDTELRIPVSLVVSPL